MCNSVLNINDELSMEFVLTNMYIYGCKYLFIILCKIVLNKFTYSH